MLEDTKEKTKEYLPYNPPNVLKEAWAKNKQISWSITKENSHRKHTRPSMLYQEFAHCLPSDKQVRTLSKIFLIKKTNKVRPGI